MYIVVVIAIWLWLPVLEIFAHDVWGHEIVVWNPPGGEDFTWLFPLFAVFWPRDSVRKPLCSHNFLYKHRQVTDEDGIPANIIHNLPTQVLQESHRLIIDGSNCGVCLQGFQTHQCIKTLPCQHPFHITCIDTWLTNHSQCPVDGSYIGSVSTAGSVATLQPNGHTVPGVGRFTTASNSTHALGGAGKRPGQRLKGLSERNESAKSLPSSFTLSGSGLLAGNNNNRSRWVTQNDWLPYRMGG